MIAFLSKGYWYDGWTGSNAVNQIQVTRAFSVTYPLLYRLDHPHNQVMEWEKYNKGGKEKYYTKFYEVYYREIGAGGFMERNPFLLIIHGTFAKGIPF